MTACACFTRAAQNARRGFATAADFDAVSIVFFVATATLAITPAILIADMVVGRGDPGGFPRPALDRRNRLRHMRQIYVLVDLVVLASLVAAPILGQGWTALRLLRALRLVHSYHLLRDLRRDWRFFRLHEDAILATVNLLVFIFAMTALVYVLRAGREPGLVTYIDALYFTVTTLTTTGFGDIAMESGTGRVLAVGIMVIGVGLFLRLARAIFVPAKVRHKCPECGLLEARPGRDPLQALRAGAEDRDRGRGAD